MHVVLLGAVGEARDPLHDRVVRPRHVDAVVDDVAGMRDPLAADHELVFDAFAECVPHAAVMAGKADAACNGRNQICCLLLGDLPHGVDRHHQAEFGERGIGEGFGGVGNATEKPSSSSHSRKMPAQRSGSWPSHPPQTINALRITTPCCDPPGFCRSPRI